MNNERTMTIYDIAKEAGVSTATVSRILSDHPGVKQEKRDRVRAIIQKYDFKPNAMARNLSETHSKIIGMLCPDICNYYYSRLFEECEREACERGYMLVLNNTFAKENLEVHFMEYLMSQRAESLIICGGVGDWNPLPELYRNTLERLVKRLPVIVAGQIAVEGCWQIGIDQREGMRLAVRHLATLGHRRIAFLHGYPHIYQTQEKLAAFHETMDELGIPVRPEFVVNAGQFTREAGVIGMKKLLSLPELPTAVIGINDLIIAGALQAILRLGYSVPKDFSIIGFDDSLATDLAVPHITSVHYDYAEYGRRLIHAALAAIGGEKIGNPQCVPVTLSIKESCRKILVDS